MDAPLPYYVFLRGVNCLFLWCGYGRYKEACDTQNEETKVVASEKKWVWEI